MKTTLDLEISNLKKAYNKSPVLDIDALKISAGQFVALMGKNGSGKSTFMRLIAQQELYDSGDIRFQGQSLSSTKVKINSENAFISEDHELPFSIKLGEWAKMFQKIYPQFDDNLLRQLTQSLDVDLQKSYQALSRGQKMKALFSLLAAKKPSIYMLDEITAVLDSGSRWTLMQFLKEELKRGCLIMMSTNIASEMQGFATDVVFLKNGKINFSSKCSDLGARFVKIRVPKDLEPTIAKNWGGRKILFNNDESWTYLCSKAQLNTTLPSGVETDKREVNIADVQAFFTAEESEV